MRATMPAKMMSEMPLPMPRSVICSPSHMTKVVPAVSVSTVMSSKRQPGMLHDLQRHPGRLAGVLGVLEDAGDAVALRDGQQDVAVAGVLVDLLAAGLALSSGASRASGTTTVSSWRMIEAEMYGMIPSAKIENCSSAPPENRLNMPEEPAGLDELLHGLAVHARRGDEDADAVDRQHADGEEQPPAQLLNLEDVGQGCQLR